MTPNLIPIAHVSRRVATLTGQPGPSPRKIYDLALRGTFPAEFVNGRWYVAPDDVVKVAAALGMSVQHNEAVAA